MAALQVVDAHDGWAKPPKPGAELGSAFGYDDRLFSDFKNGDVLDYGEIRAREMAEMMRAEYKARQIEACLALPALSSKYAIKPAKGDKGEAAWLNEFWEEDPEDGGCKNSLQEIIAMCVSAFTYRRAYFELTFKPGKGGKRIVYDKVAFRPQTTCRLARDARTGEVTGFEQEAYGPVLIQDNMTDWPVRIDKSRAYVFIHGTRFDPIQGTSDLDITYWAWRTKQKLLFLWFQFLENVALPRTVVSADDQATANDIARKVAMLKGSGVLPVATSGNPGSVDIKTLDVSGKGAEQFMAVIKWLDQAATNSVLAGFLDLTSQAAGGSGSYALSKDASDFFLQARQADVREMADSIRRGLFAPLVRYNFGPRAAIPLFEFEPLNSEDKSVSVTMLSALLSQRTPEGVPNEFIGELAAQVATYLGLDGEEVRKGFERVASVMADEAAAKAKLAAAMPAQMAPKGQTSDAAQSAEANAAAVGGAAVRKPSTDDGPAAPKPRRAGKAHSGDPVSGVPGK